MADTDRINDYLDKAEIRDLLYLYCRAIDRADSDLLASIFTPEARCDYGLFSGTISEFRAFARSFVDAIGPTHHNITNSLIQLSGDKAVGESYGIAVHGDVSEAHGPVDLIVFVRYNDRFERREGKWKIAHREVVYDWNQHIPRTADWDGPLGALYLPRGRRGPDDVTYAARP